MSIVFVQLTFESSAKAQYFRPDPRLSERESSTLSAYTNSLYTKGHLAAAGIKS